jgi:predicted nucleic acid-binding protein
MIADTTFLSDLLREQRAGQRGAASAFLTEHRREPLRTSIISAGELAVMFAESWQAWEWLRLWKTYPLHPGVAQSAADIDRLLIRRGRRLGENDNWIAGFAAYYREPVISHDLAFDGLPHVRRVHYAR